MPPLERPDGRKVGAYKVWAGLASRCNVENVRKEGCFCLNFPLSRGAEMPMISETGIVHPTKTASAGGRVTPETTEQLRHAAFFSELSSLGDSDSSWRAVTAGLVVLRLVDAWV